MQIELNNKHGLASLSYNDVFGGNLVMWGHFMRPGKLAISSWEEGWSNIIRVCSVKLCVTLAAR